MAIYKPTHAPQAPPLIWGEQYYTVPPSEATWRDYEIRRGMDKALRVGLESVKEITKLLQQTGLESLHSVEITYPYIQPPSVYKPGCMTAHQENENRLLRDFAFESYDALADHFGDATWFGWFIAPYLPVGDDTHMTCNIGIFVDEQFFREMIE